jgi:hypothetical protein
MGQACRSTRGAGALADLGREAYRPLPGAPSPPAPQPPEHPCGVDPPDGPPRDVRRRPLPARRRGAARTGGPNASGGPRAEVETASNRMPTVPARSVATPQTSPSVATRDLVPTRFEAVGADGFRALVSDWDGLCASRPTTPLPSRRHLSTRCGSPSERRVATWSSPPAAPPTANCAPCCRWSASARGSRSSASTRFGRSRCTAKRPRRSRAPPTRSCWRSGWRTTCSVPTVRRATWSTSNRLRSVANCTLPCTTRPPGSTSRCSAGGSRPTR